MIHIYENPYQSIRLKYQFPEDADQVKQIDFAKKMLEAVFKLTFFEPLKIDLRLAYFDPEFDSEVTEDAPQAPFWMFKQTHLAENVKAEAYWINETITKTATITYPKAIDWVTNACNANLPQNGSSVGVSQMIFRTNRCILPAQHQSKNETISVKERAHIYQCPIEHKNDQVWVTGAISPFSLYAPVEVMVSKQYSEIELDISFYWSIYDFNDSTQANIVNVPVQELLKQGWRLA
ncbi:hypothetical protein [Microscilla marina]|uniref:Uncharacterized protein n=1 Tax=Microscilla marina ATCC 23134 TaxID=313606 RepID=A1ZL50_MICM2|nr:hypothetical protein [Microscilla marina]EAY29016.1 hypothetical protein M23134_00170 [Microscilla marina ATCC 23134]